MCACEYLCKRIAILGRPANSVHNMVDFSSPRMLEHFIPWVRQYPPNSNLLYTLAYCLLRSTACFLRCLRWRSILYMRPRSVPHAYFNRWIMINCLYIILIVPWIEIPYYLEWFIRHVSQTEWTNKKYELFFCLKGTVFAAYDKLGTSSTTVNRFLAKISMAFRIRTNHFICIFSWLRSYFRLYQ